MYGSVVRVVEHLQSVELMILGATVNKETLQNKNMKPWEWKELWIIKFPPAVSVLEDIYLTLP